MIIAVWVNLEWLYYALFTKSILYRKSGKKCQKHNMTKMIKPVIQLVLDLIGWPLADDLDDDYPNY